MDSTVVQCPTCSVFPLPNGRGECKCCAFWRENGLTTDGDARQASRLFLDYYGLFLREGDRREDPTRFLGTCLRDAQRTTFTVIGWLQSQLHDFPTCCCCDRHIPKKHKWRVCSDHREWTQEFRRRYGNRFADDAAINGFLVVVAATAWKSVTAAFPGENNEALWSLFEAELGSNLPPAPVVVAPASPPVVAFLEPVTSVALDPVPVDTPAVDTQVAVVAEPMGEAPPEPVLADETIITAPEPLPPSPPVVPLPAREVAKRVAKPKQKERPKQSRLPRFSRPWTQKDRNWFKRAEIFERWPWMDDDDRAVEALAAIKDRWCTRSGLPKTGPTSATTVFTRDHLEDAVARIYAARKHRAKGRRQC